MVYDLDMLKAFYAFFRKEDRSGKSSVAASADVGRERFCIHICMMMLN